MPPKPGQPRRESSAPPDSLTPQSDPLPGDLRRDNQRRTPPDGLPQSSDEDLSEDGPVTGALAPDGGVAQHPIHDEPLEDMTPGDYEELIEEAAAAGVKRNAGDDER
jgi:hypothetical protein